MDRALLYKEWKKTRLYVYAVMLVMAVLSAYVYLKIGRSFRIAGMEHFWDVIINHDQFVFRDLKYFPLAAGACIGLAQYIPEMIQKRIKLTLHLPMEERRIITLMYSYGLGILLFIFLVQITSLFVFSHFYFAYEIIENTIITIMPWYLAGFIAYSFIAMICLEPAWSRRLFGAVLAATTVQLCFSSNFPGALEPMLWVLIILTFLVIPFGFLSVYRFKQGEQD